MFRLEALGKKKKGESDLVHVIMFEYLKLGQQDEEIALRVVVHALYVGDQVNEPSDHCRE